MKNITYKLFRLSLLFLVLPFAIVAVLVVTVFIIIMSIGDRLRGPYYRRFRPDVFEKEQTQSAEMEVRSTLCLIIQEMMKSRRPWTIENFESFLRDISNPHDTEQIILRGEKEGHWVRVYNNWELTDKGAEYAEEFMRSIGR